MAAALRVCPGWTFTTPEKMRQSHKVEAKVGTTIR